MKARNCTQHLIGHDYRSCLLSTSSIEGNGRDIHIFTYKELQTGKDPVRAQHCTALAYTKNRVRPHRARYARLSLSAAAEQQLIDRKGVNRKSQLSS